jgi:hypothetical protein
MPRRPKGTDVVALFWSRVEKSDGCWLWTGGRFSTGYGSFSVGGRVRVASRLAYAYTHGPIPDGLFVCHHCDTPLCVRPDHLFLGTNADNMRDAYRKGRVRPPNVVAGRTHCVQGHEFTPENTITQKDGRTCRACKKERDRQVYLNSTKPKRQAALARQTA